MDAQFMAPVANVEKAFHVTMGLYQHPPKTAPSTLRTASPPSICQSACAYLGLDNYSIPRPRFITRIRRCVPMP